MFDSEANRKEIGHRSYLAAGIAALGVGAMALAPVQPIPHQVALAPQQVVSTLAVELAATVNPIQAWVDTLKATTANSATLLKFYLEQPFPLAKTLIANQVTYLKELFSGNANLIFPQIKTNIQTLFKAPLDPGAGQILGAVPPDFPEAVFMSSGEYVSQTITGATPQEALPATLGQIVATAWYDCWGNGDDTCDLPGQVTPIMNTFSTYGSGMLLAALGPVLAPVLSLGDSLKAIAAILKSRKAGRFLNLAYEILNIPANMTNAFLNGGPVLDLTKLAAKLLPVEPEFFGFRMGGLLNAVPVNGSLVDPENPPTKYSGGTGFDAVNAVLGTEIVGLPIGLGGSMVGMGQYLAGKLKVTPPAPTAAAVAPASAVVAEAPAAVADDAPAAVAPAPESAPAVSAAAPAVSAAAEESAPAVSAPTRKARPSAAANTGRAKANAGGDDSPRSRTGRGTR